MSAPPIGITISTPRTAATTTIKIALVVIMLPLGVMTIQIANATIARPSAACREWRAAPLTGWTIFLPDSLR